MTSTAREIRWNVSSRLDSRGVRIDFAWIADDSNYYVVRQSHKFLIRTRDHKPLSSHGLLSDALDQIEYLEEVDAAEVLRIQAEAERAERAAAEQDAKVTPIFLGIRREPLPGVIVEAVDVDGQRVVYYAHGSHGVSGHAFLRSLPSTAYVTRDDLGWSASWFVVYDYPVRAVRSASPLVASVN